MALGSPLFTVDTTSTDGIGTYTLDDPASPGAGLRTLADAVAMGVLSDGDTVEYEVRDKTKEGTALLYEHGVGTVGSSGSTLTRDTIIQNHLGTTAKVSWPSGGSRSLGIVLAPENVCRTANNLSDVNAVTAAANLGVPRLAAANTFTEPQTVGKDVVGTHQALVIQNTSSGAVTKGVSELLRVKNSAGTQVNAFQIFAKLTDITAGSEDSEAQLNVLVNGAITNAVKFSGSTALDASGSKYDAFPTGTRLLLGNSTLPTGWSLVSSLADKTILTTSTLTEIDDQGGTWTITGLTGAGATAGYTLTEADIPSHTHGVGLNDGSAPAITSRLDDDRIAGPSSPTGTQATTATGGGGSHSHTISGLAVSSSGAWRPAYYKAGWMEKS